MIKEAIQFVERFEQDKTESSEKSEEWRGRKFIIVNTKEDEDKGLSYDGFEILKNDGEIEKWIKKHDYYGSFLENFSYYIFPRQLDSNKALGSKQGLMTFTLLSFKLSEKNLENFKVKLQKTNIKNLCNEKSELKLLEKIKNLYYLFYEDLLKECKNGLGGLKRSFSKFITMINLDNGNFNKLFDITKKYIEESSRKLRKSSKNVTGRCFVCGNESPISTSGFFSSYASGKLFLYHKTRSSKDNEGSPNLICEECELKLKEFQKLLNDYKLKIFPLFINQDLQQKEIKLIKKEGYNSFRFVFEQLSKNKLLNNLDFYLFVRSGDYFSFDYVTNYSLVLGSLRVYFDSLQIENKIYNKNSEIKNINRFFIEQSVSKIFDNKTYLDYFNEKIKGEENKLVNLKYKIRQKLFDFVYRNKNSLKNEDIEEILIYRIEKDIKNNLELNKKGDIRRFLNFFFNLHLIGERMEEPILEKVSDMMSCLKTEDYGAFSIRNDNEWAYWCGQIAFFLAWNSKSSNRDFGLLEPFINNSVSDQLKRTIIEFFEKYKHEIDLDNRRFKEVINKILNHQPTNKSFNKLKTSFYTGVFDDNIFLNKRVEGNNNG